MWSHTLGKEYVDLVQMSKDRAISEIIVRKKEHVSRPQWPRCLRHEMSLPVRTNGIVGSNPSQGIDVSLPFVSVLSFVGRGCQSCPTDCFLDS
jgi:hypothetical protein